MRARPNGRALRVVLIVLALVMTTLVPGAAQAAPAPASRFVPLAPQRVLDTRDGLGAPAAALPPGAALDLQVIGRGGVPASEVTAVTLNVVVTGSPQVGYVQVVPTGRGVLGSSSNLNVHTPRQTVAGLATVPVGDGGRVTLFTVAGGHLVADVLGYFTATAASTDGRYRAVAPTRLLDSRDRTGMSLLDAPVPPSSTHAAPPTSGTVDQGTTTAALPRPADVDCGDFASWTEANDWFWRYQPDWGDVAGLDADGDLIPCEGLRGAPAAPQPPVDPYPQPRAGEAVVLQVAGRGGVPAAGATAVTLTVTAADGSGPGFVQVAPTGGTTALGATSNLNVSSAGQTVANLVMVPLGADGTVTLYTSSGADLVVDVAGYFTGPGAPAAADGLFVPLDPARLVDSRDAGIRPAGSQLVLSPLGGAAGVPASGVAATFLNVTATGTTGPGYLQVFPTGRSTPGSSSSVNYTGPDQAVATAAIGGVGDGGRTSVHTSTTTHVVVDVFGYFTGPGGPAGPQPGGAPTLDDLVVAPAAPQAPYDRAAWDHWTDEDGDCQNTRQEVLVAESLTTVVLDRTGCSVVWGTWVDPYTGRTWTAPSDLDVDHVVALKNAHDSGGWAWDAARRRAFANDLRFDDHLIAVEDGVNQAKGSRGPDAWRPPAPSAQCVYATAWITVKATWSLTVTTAERDALADLLTTC